MYVSSPLNLWYEANCRYHSFHCAKVESFDSSLPSFMVLPIILRTQVQQQTQWAEQSVLLHGGTLVKEPKVEFLGLVSGNVSGSLARVGLDGKS